MVPMTLVLFAVAIGLIYGASELLGTAVLEGLFWLLVTVVEFIWFTLTQGPTKGMETVRLRRAERAETTNKPLGKKTTIALACFLIGSVMIVLFSFAWHRIQFKRLQATKIQLEKLAAQYVLEVEDGASEFAEKAELAEIDSWGQAIQREVSHSLTGTTVTYTSSGPDQEDSTMDDLVVKHRIQASVREMSGELVKGAANKLRDRIGGMLPSKEKQKIDSP